MKKSLPEKLSNNEIGSRKVAGDRFNEVLAVLAGYEECERCGALVGENKMGQEFPEEETSRRTCLRCRVEGLGKSWDDTSSDNNTTS